MRAIVQAVVLIGLACGGGARAEDLWGCEVLLCLSNPAGPEAVAECQPPIERLWRHLRNGHPFPTCPSAGNSYARPTFSYYDLCPARTTELPAGQFGAAVSAPRVVYAGIGDGGMLVLGSYARVATGFAPLPPKVCVGARVGQGLAFVPVPESDQWAGRRFALRTVGYYDRVQLLPAYHSSNVIDIYIQNARQLRVRW